MNEPSQSRDDIGPPVPFDRELEEPLAAVATFMPRFESMEDVERSRAAAADLEPITLEQLRRGGAFDVEEVSVPGPYEQRNVNLLVLRTAGTRDPAPVVFHIHGGGMIGGNHRVISEELLDWVLELGVVIVSVDYRLAPETPHPGPVEDAYAGLVWVAAHSERLRIDPDHLILLGASAGGGIAAATTLLARDRGGPVVSAQMLLCPMLDDRNDTVSAHQGEGRGVWDRRANEVGWTALLGDRRGRADVPSSAAPARETDLSGLPPAYLDVGSAETFRDETVAYASTIWQQGGVADLHVFAGGFHGYDVFAPLTTISQRTRQVRRAWLEQVLGGGR